MAFRYEAHVGVNAESGLVHTVVGTAANVNDFTQGYALLHGGESNVFADAGNQGVENHDETQDIKAEWHVAMCPGKRPCVGQRESMGKAA